MEFYLKCWHGDLVCVLNSSFFSRNLSSLQSRGIFTLSFKKGDHLDPKNWRPITLSNVDYKIASRSITARLLEVVHLVVDKKQTCGVSARVIGETVAFLRDVVSFCSSSGVQVTVALLSLDQERHSTGSIGRSCVLLCLLWVLGRLLLGV